MSKLRVYLDTSVFGGYFDDEFRSVTVEFFDRFLRSRGIALISDTLVAELAAAPDRVQELLRCVLDWEIERLQFDDAADRLHRAYLTSGVVSEKWSDDALHVAHASVTRADVIASWNFRHLVNARRIRAFSRVNGAHGYDPIVILTPDDILHAWSDESDGESP